VEIVNDLLLAAANEVPDGSAPEIDVVVLVEQAVQTMRVLADPRAVQLDFVHDHRHGSAADRKTLARIPATSLQRCVIALLDNAIAHSPNGSGVTVTLRSSKTAFDLVVADQGSGIRGIDPANIFDRFAHSTAPEYSSSAPQRSGFGIGLSLVRDIAVRNGGRVELSTTSAAGTTFTLTLPLAR
jgi:signal transduction histidine kinase